MKFAVVCVLLALTPSRASAANAIKYGAHEQEAVKKLFTNFFCQEGFTYFTVEDMVYKYEQNMDITYAVGATSPEKFRPWADTVFNEIGDVIGRPDWRETPIGNRKITLDNLLQLFNPEKAKLVTVGLHVAFCNIFFALMSQGNHTIYHARFYNFFCQLLKSVPKHQSQVLFTKLADKDNKMDNAEWHKGCGNFNLLYLLTLDLTVFFGQPHIIISGNLYTELGMKYKGKKKIEDRDGLLDAKEARKKFAQRLRTGKFRFGIWGKRKKMADNYEKWFQVFVDASARIRLMRSVKEDCDKRVEITGRDRNDTLTFKELAGLIHPTNDDIAKDFNVQLYLAYIIFAWMDVNLSKSISKDELQALCNALKFGKWDVELVFAEIQYRTEYREEISEEQWLAFCAEFDNIASMLCQEKVIADPTDFVVSEECSAV